MLSRFARSVERLTIPSKMRSRLRDPEPLVRKFLARHKNDIPSDFFDELPTFENLLPKQEYRPTHFKEVRCNNPSGSPGQYLRRKFHVRTQGDAYASKHVVDHMHFLTHLLKRGCPMTFVANACVVSSVCDFGDENIFSRTFEPTHKLRVAWVYDLTLLHIEKMFAQSISDEIDFTKHIPKPETFHNQWCTPFTYQLDISSFDASVPRWLIYTAFAIIFSRFNLEYYLGRGKVNKRFSLQHLVNVIIHNFIYTKFTTTTNSTIRQKKNGVPSGSAFTNIIDSIISKLLCSYVLRKELSRPLYHVHTYGDDTMFKTALSFNPDSILATYESLGFKIRFEPQLANGCNIYCKAWCLGGIQFHPGKWFSNILSCCRDDRYWNSLIYALILTYRPTTLQTTELLRLVRDPIETLDIPSWMSYMLTNGRSATMAVQLD
uniref:RdRp n=1 Tax=Hubei coleoptera virus 5 TaxID=1922864 RepID=A0A1L3KLM2_9VIRU|nr:RdRp [Hubei coleoptera virus 5]